MLNRLSGALVNTVLALSLAIPCAAQQRLTLTDIGARTQPVGGSTGLYINPTGIIAGTAQPSGGDAAFVWMPSAANASTGAYTLLPTPSNTATSDVHGINTAGQILGTRTYAAGTYKSKGKTYTRYVTVSAEWSYSSSTGWSEADLPSGTPNMAFNDYGEIVGGTTLMKNGVAYALPGLNAVSINEVGQVVGLYATNGSTDTYTGYLWTPSSPNGMTGKYVTFPFYPSQVNINGLVAGFPEWAPNGAAVYYPSSNETQVVVSGGFFAASINNNGLVGGMGSSFNAFLWDGTDGVRYLNDTTQFSITNGAGWNFIQVLGVNDYGQVVGYGTDPSGAQRTFLLTP